MQWTPPVPPPPTATKRRAWVWVIAGGLVLALLAALIVVAVRASDNGTPSVVRTDFSMHEVVSVAPIPRSHRCPTPSLPDRDHVSCLRLGGAFGSIADVRHSVAVIDQSGAWQIDVTLDPALISQLRSRTGQLVAIVVNGVVESAPKVLPGITGPNVTITGKFTEREARALALLLRGESPG